VAQNLIDNAVKFSPSGGTVIVEIGVAANREEAMEVAGRRWANAGRISLHTPPPGALGRRFGYLRVVDSGQGIAIRHLPRLGERFFRVEREKGSDRGGTGLGLAIVKHIVSRHRGGLLVESELDRGSAFAVYFECAD
jgi:two-component system phosphate regulon sensor histidine kinase PhoR